jgi:phosphatidylethanolamine/phosphatidyl-N-methylethanolamine N-methyltransferase
MRQDDVTRIYQRNAAWYDLMHGPLERMAVGRWRSRALEGLTGRVLELGVGTGASFRHYGPEAHITAADPSTRMLDRTRRRADRLGISVELVQAGAERLPFADATFDAVVGTFVFCSIAEPRRGVEEARRVLKPGGALRLLEHQRPPGALLGRAFDVVDPLARRLTGASITRETDALVRSAGFPDARSLPLDRLRIVRLIIARARKYPGS